MRLTAFALSLVFITVATAQSPPGGGGGGSSANSWNIDEPDNEETFNIGSSVPCNGTAGDANHSYTISVTDEMDTNLGGADGESTDEGMNSTWSCSAVRMSGNWPTGIANVWLYVAGEEEAASHRTIEFVN